MMPSWSSEICSSNSDTSMPRLSTSRILPMPSVMFLPGMNAPGGANTPFMPVRAFGAPHTTWIGVPSPASTMQTRSRSALGCGFASMTRATTNGANSFALSSMRSTSSPILVSLSATSSSERSVARCSWSQPKVSFIMSDASRTEPSGKRRPIERAEAVVREPAHVSLEEGAQIRHAVFQHGNAINSHAPSEPLIGIGIEPAVAQHVGMHHSAAQDLHPVLALAEADLALVAPALDVDLERRLGEGKERRAKTHPDLVHLEERLAEFLQDPFEVSEMGASVDDKAFDLMEHRRVRLVAVAAIGAARYDHADRRRLCKHRPDLHRRCVRAQQKP